MIHEPLPLSSTLLYKVHDHLALSLIVDYFTSETKKVAENHASTFNKLYEQAYLHRYTKRYATRSAAFVFHSPILYQLTQNQ